jgi:hypothetical protein
VDDLTGFFAGVGETGHVCEEEMVVRSGREPGGCGNAGGHCVKIPGLRRRRCGAVARLRGVASDRRRQRRRVRRRGCSDG